jgi:small ligand-binding sensory domain FIST
MDSAMSDFSFSFSRAPTARSAASELAIEAEAELGEPGEIAGGLLLATAAAGSQGPEVGRLLSERWPGAELVGTSFEGLVSDGRVWRDEPALGLLAWRSRDREPFLVAFEAGEQAAERIADGILAAAGVTALEPSDLVLLFPDAHGLPPIDNLLRPMEALLGCPAIAGAAASGIDGAPARVWVGPEEWGSGGLIGVVIPGRADPSRASPLVQTVGASRTATTWLEVTSCRSRWIDRLEGDVALARVRRELDLAAGEALEPYLDRLLVRLRRAGRSPIAAPDEAHDDERYIVGVDDQRGSFSIPIEVERGDRVALAWPDASLAREGLRGSLDELGASPWLLQFSCRSRDEGLHGDDDLESAWVAAHAVGRRVLGTVAPFQLGPGPGTADDCRMLVHSSVLAALLGS